MHEEHYPLPPQAVPPEQSSLGGKGEARQKLESTSDRLVEFLRQEYTIPGIDVYVEIKFEQMGLLPSLEQAGILSKAENPNPFDPDKASAQHNQWWAEHPEAENLFSQELAKRAEVLRYLHIGALVREMAGHRFYAGRDLPTLAVPSRKKE